jgi:hypothetical protein
VALKAEIGSYVAGLSRASAATMRLGDFVERFLFERDVRSALITSIHEEIN